MLDANFSEFQNIYLDISVISWPRLNTCIIGLRLGVILNGFNDTQATGLSRKNSRMTQVQTTVAKMGDFFNFLASQEPRIQPIWPQVRANRVLH